MLNNGPANMTLMDGNLREYLARHICDISTSHTIWRVLEIHRSFLLYCTPYGLCGCFAEQKTSPLQSHRRVWINFIRTPPAISINYNLLSTILRLMCTLILLCSCFACHRRRRHRKERWALAGMAVDAANIPIPVHYTAHFNSIQFKTAVESIARGIIR